MSRILFVASLLLALGGSSSAAEVHLGPETAVTPWPGSPPAFLRVARSGDHEIAVWSDQLLRLFVPVNGRAISIGVLGSSNYSLDPPAVAASNSNFLIVWHDTTGLMLGQRVGFDGSLLDTLPVVLSAGSTGPPSVASDGSTYLVSWSGSAGGAFTVRVASDGVVGNRSNFATAYQESFPMQVVWTGTGFFLGYTMTYSSCPTPCYSWVEISGTPLDTAGQPSPQSLSKHKWVLQDAPVIAMAAGGGRVTFVWLGMTVAQTNSDGTAIADPRTVVPLSCGSRVPAIGWDGAEFVIAWIDCSMTLHALRLDQLGNLIGEPFDVATSVADADPLIAPASDGVVIVYSRPDPSNGKARIAFERSLARLSSPRRRVVTR